MAMILTIPMMPIPVVDDVFPPGREIKDYRVSGEIRAFTVDVSLFSLGKNEKNSCTLNKYITLHNLMCCSGYTTTQWVCDQVAIALTAARMSVLLLVTLS